MLAANEKTRQLLSHPIGTTLQEIADRQSVESIRRFSERKSAEYAHAHIRVEYDGEILRCIASDNDFLDKRSVQFDEEITKIDPMRKGEVAWMRAQMSGNVVWWHDLRALQMRYREMKNKVTPLTGDASQRLESVPVVIGGDWEFNAWACPAGGYGDFIMVNWGFLHCYSYAAMFIEIFEGARQGAEAGKSSGIVASSMIWMAATALGYEALQYDNLCLPHSERDRIWQSVQQPSERLAHAVAVIDAFAILHECGHIAKGHLDTTRGWQTEENLNADDKADRYRQMRAFEFEADAFACEAFRSIAPDGRGFFEPLLILFSMIQLCERHSSPSLVSKHPAAAARFRACMEALGQDAEADCRLLQRYVEMVVNASKSRLEWQSTTQKAEMNNEAGPDSGLCN